MSTLRLAQGRVVNLFPLVDAARLTRALLLVIAGFAFLCYEDQRSTVLCVDNLNGAKVAGRIIRVEHVDDYRQKKKELDVDQDGEDGGEAADADGGLAAHPRDAVERTAAAAADRVGETSRRGPAAIANPAGGPFPWESKDSVFSILQEAKRDVYGEDDEGGGAGTEARERRRERSGEGERRGGERHKRRKHKHRHRHG